MEVPGLLEGVLQAFLRRDGGEVDGRLERASPTPVGHADVPRVGVLEVLLHDDAGETYGRDDGYAVGRALVDHAAAR